MFKRLWNADFANYNIPRLSLLWIIVAIGVAYVELQSPLVINFSAMFEKFLDLNPDNEALRFWLLVIFAVFSIYIAVLVCVHEQASYSKIGQHKLNSIALPHFLVNILDLACVILLVLLTEKMLDLAFGITISLEGAIGGLLGIEGKNHPFQSIIDFYNTHIPTYIDLPYLIAIPIVFICADFPIYLAHYLTHKSRFLWLVAHRSHHSPEFLTPFGSGPVFAFSLLTAIPYFFATLALSKLIYPDPIIVEVMVIQLIYACTEKFNHTSAFYSFTSKHRWFFSFFGNGPYHYTHHSAREGEEIVNLGNLGFNFWDRVFGTFKEPDREKPPVGLTHQPEIHLNPFRLYFSGVCTIGYELKHNHPKHWFRILFGSVYYVPPKTKDYLIKSYPGPLLYPVDH